MRLGGSLLQKLLFINIGQHSFEVFGTYFHSHFRFFDTLELDGYVSVVARFFDCGEDLICGDVAVTEDGGAAEVAATGSVKAPAGVVHHSASGKGILGMDKAYMGQ